MLNLKLHTCSQGRVSVLIWSQLCRYIDCQRNNPALVSSSLRMSPGDDQPGWNMKDYIRCTCPKPIKSPSQSLYLTCCVFYTDTDTEVNLGFQGQLQSFVAVCCCCCGLQRATLKKYPASSTFMYFNRLQDFDAFGLHTISKERKAKLVRQVYVRVLKQSSLSCFNHVYVTST